MASFYRSDVAAFLALEDEQILARLELAYATHGYTTQFSDQTLTWKSDLANLRRCLEACTAKSAFALSWGILLEFSIPRKEMRVDAVLLVRDVVVVIEAKSVSTGISATRQLEEYALLLHYFHQVSDHVRILPILISPNGGVPDLVRLNQREFFSQLPSYWVASVVHCTWDFLSSVLLSAENGSTYQIDVQQWDASRYFPVPSILEAAIELKGGLSIREIAHSEASLHEIEDVADTVQRCLNRARQENRHSICFLTGVPGSGKTLVGLSLAHSDENKSDAIHFMSGNGPLVKVLQHLFTHESRRKGASRAQANIEAKTLIENIHVFARNYTDDDPGPPSNHAIIFDEAQRAWNRAQNMRKFRRDYSEPEMLLKIMERHADWALIIALVGGGQEINDGEAGLEEWGKALTDAKKNWLVYASPEVLEGGASTAGHRLFERLENAKSVLTTPTLHLKTSRRSLRADHLATWVNLVVEGNANGAAALRIADRFPIFLSRELNATRDFLKCHNIGENRCGLVGSSGAARLRADGLEPSSSFHAEYPWEHWYLAEKSDVRSSHRCEVFATEFEIQGLELDWIGLCWGGDFIWRCGSGWQLRALRHGKVSRWAEIKHSEKRVYRRNAYRVLLTRARKGMVIFVPRGNKYDPTNAQEEFDSTCGISFGVWYHTAHLGPIRVGQLRERYSLRPLTA
jgi:hypothetical protein